jgi:predicted transposase/invertase (TIGR01784 family)
MIEVTEDERQRAIMRSRRMYETDRMSDLLTAKDEGKREKALEIADKLIAKGMSVNDVADATGLTVDEILQR